jgi:hypothetical protein
MPNNQIQIPDSASNETSDNIRAHGDVKARIGVLWLVGAILGILAIGGICAFFFKPDNAKDIWVIIGPIISAGITGTVAFLSGERSGRK